MNVYADTSALVKLIAVEDESAALRSWLAERGGLLTSRIGVVELHRVAARLHADDRTVSRAIAQLGVVPLTEAVLAAAGRIGPPTLRTLDAIHLATAVDVADAAHLFVTYDRRQAESATALGLDVVGPPDYRRSALTSRPS